MPRPPRIQEIGGLYHCVQHSVDDLVLYRSDTDRELFLRYVGEEVSRSGWQCLAYSLMKTHYHLLIRLTKETLSSGFQRLNSRYAQTYNRTYGRRGHVFERRFRDVMIESESHRYEVTRYIHLNAPRANACGAPDEHVWCDYAATVGLASPDPLVDPRRTLELFGSDLRVARQRYLAFIEEPDVRIRRGQTRVRPRG